MKKVFSFGEDVKGYDIKFFNEREVRAGAGILFVSAIVSFMNSWLLGNFFYTKVFVVIFLIDFTIRLFINPKFAPSMILARLFVGNQKPEYVGAPQKRFAWGLGFVLGLVMLYTLVLNSIVGPMNMLICITCLILFGFESIFGICVGCKIYNLFNKDKSKLCAGGVCENNKKEDIQKTSIMQVIILIISIIGITFIFHSFKNTKVKSAGEVINNLSTEELNKGVDNCVVPDWAKAIGHEEMWKLHHHCK